jgi:hypothetical protein
MSQVSVAFESCLKIPGANPLNLFNGINRQNIMVHTFLYVCCQSTAINLNKFSRPPTVFGWLEFKADIMIEYF